MKNLETLKRKHIQEEDDSARPALFHTAHGDPQSTFEKINRHRAVVQIGGTMGRAPKSQHAQLARISHAAVGSLQHPATPHTESLPPWQTWMSQGASSQASGQLLQSPCGHGPTPESGDTRTAVGQASTATRRNSTTPSAAYRATRQPRSTSPQWQCPGCHDAHPSRAPPPCSAPATSGR